VRRSRWSVLLPSVLVACARGESRPVDAAGAARARPETVAPPAGLPDAGVRATRPAYRGGPVTGGGTLSGTVLLAGALPPEPAPDSAALADPAVARACGGARRGGGRGARRARAADPVGEPPGASAGPARGAVVWLEGVAAGKPMPLERRYELTLEGCALAPRTLAAAAGGTLNVHGVDALASRLVFVRGDAGDAGRVLLRTAMSAPGQLVPDEGVLAEPGLVEVRGERPAWLRAWVLAFDQPYFAAAGDDGAFTLADVPPGRYQLVAWHPRAGRVAQPVTVAAGQAQTVTLPLPAGR
jgi:hypothetical protein